MKIIYFIRLIQRHLLLLILVPLLIAAVVYFVTRSSQGNYYSETTIYTGITSGYSVQQQSSGDLMAKMIVYDNLMNLIRSRQTLEEVSVSLLAQHLLLDHYDPRYISKENYEDLLSKVPPDVVNIVKREKRNDKRYYRPPSKGTTSLDGLPADGQESMNNNDRMRSDIENSNPKKNYHVVRPGETMYSISKSHGISVHELMSYNHVNSHSIEVGQKLKVGEVFTPQASPPPQQGEYEPEPSPSSPSSVGDTTSSMQDYYTPIDSLSSNFHANTDTTTFDKIVKRLLAYGHQNDYNFIYQLWNSETDRFYSIRALSGVITSRIQNSDLLKLSYTCPDPGICQQTLIFLTKVFILNYKLLKQNQTDAVIQYFKRQLEDAMRRLQKAENDLLLFNERNNIINYYEQTKVIATTKEELDVTYQNKQIAYASSDAAIKIIERKLESHAKLSLNTSAILQLRSELSDATMQIANIEIDLGNDSATIIQLANLKARVESLKQAIKVQIDRLYMVNNSVEGLPLKELLASWLNNVIAYEESKAALRVLAERKNYYRQVYEVFAPLGAEMKRIERLIGVTEEEFLTILHDLNMAKLRQQDDELTSNLKVVDPPYYPLHALRGKGMLLVIIAGLIGFVLILTLLIAMEFFDTTIKTPERAEKFIKLKLAGVYPQIARQIYTVDIGFILPRLVEMIVQNIKLALLNNTIGNIKKPVLILLFSTRDAEGKTTIAREVSRKMRSFGENVLFLNYIKEQPGSQGYVNSGELIPATDDEFQYVIRENFFETSDFSDLMTGLEHLDSNSYDYIFVELPSLINNPYPLELIQKFNFSLLVTRANRSWTSADASALKSFTSIIKHSAQIVLNGVELIYLDSILGELPKQRSKFRRTMKRILMLQFREKNIV